MSGAGDRQQNRRPGAGQHAVAESPELESRTIKLRILDRSVQLGCRADQEDELLEAAAHVDASLRDLRARNASSSIEKIAIVAAINLASELLQARRDNDEQVALSAQLRKLNEDITNLLGEHEKHTEPSGS